jgi:hypothetical protein
MAINYFCSHFLKKVVVITPIITDLDFIIVKSLFSKQTFERIQFEIATMRLGYRAKIITIIFDRANLECFPCL